MLRHQMKLPTLARRAVGLAGACYSELPKVLGHQPLVDLPRQSGRMLDVGVWPCFSRCP